MKRALRALTAASVAVSLAACGAFGITSGTVVEMDYDDADHYPSTCYRTQWRTVTKPVTKSTTVNGKTTTTTKMETRRESYRVPYSCMEYDPEHYRLRLRDGDRENWHTVSVVEYRRCEVGAYYSDKARMCRAQ